MVDFSPDGNAPRGQVSHIEIPDTEAGRRLDNFLGRQLGGLPRAAVYRLIRTGQVRINGKRARPDTRLETGDKVRLPPVRVEESRAESGKDIADPARFETWVLHEDARVIVVNKPSGLAVHGGSGLQHGLIDIARLARPAAARLDLVHRLDRETSGCLLLAKDSATLRALNADLAARDFHKHYSALLLGSPRADRFTVDAPLDVTQREHGERHAVVSPEGQTALTLFEVKQRLPGWTLVDASPATGRTHQIRAHARHVGHPVAGDRRYRLDPTQPVAPTGLRRLFLHARRLGFPLDGAMIEVEAPLPRELAQCLARLAALATPADAEEPLP